MSDRKTPRFNRDDADEHYADPARAGQRPGVPPGVRPGASSGVQAGIPSAAQSAYAEDPLIELARIVSESAHTSPANVAYEGEPYSGEAATPVAPAAPAAPQEYSLPDDFGSDLEAELMAELAPVYTPEAQPAGEPAPQSTPQVAPPAAGVQPEARRAEPPRVTHPLPRATPRVPAGEQAAHSIPASEARRAAQASRIEERAAEPAQDFGYAGIPGYETEPFFDPSAYTTPQSQSQAQPQSQPVDDSSRYTDAAVEALEAAVQEELRLAGYVADAPAGYEAEPFRYEPQPVAPEPVQQEPFVQAPEPIQAEPEYAREVATPQAYEPVEPEALYASAQAGELRGSFDQDYAQSYGQDAYPGEPAAFAPQEPVFSDAPAFSHDAGYSDAELRATERRAPAVDTPAFAEPQAAAPVEPRFDVDDMQWPVAEGQGGVPGYGEPHFDDGQRLGGQRQDDDFELDDIFEAEETAAPQRLSQGVLPEHPKAEKRAAPRAEPKRRGLVAAAAVGAIVVLGGGAFLLSGLFGGDGASGPPVRIAAEKGPFKVFPEATKASAEPSPSKAIYDRVAGVQPRDEQLVPREEEPISAVPTTGGDDLRTVGGNIQEPDTPARPKRVRTVVVRPDGTIIAAPDLPGASASVEPPKADAAPTLDTTPQAAPGANANIRTVNARPVDSMAEAAGNSVMDSNGEARVPSTPLSSAAGAAVGETLMPRPKPEAPETRVASAEPAGNAPIQRSGPLDLTGGNIAQPTNTPRAAAATSSANIPSGSYVVQVSSQRTLEQAEQAYASMQRRFPSVLGNVQAVYPSVDLGDRGTFYRVRIVAGGQAEANDLCSQLKAAGGDCFVRRSE